MVGESLDDNKTVAVARIIENHSSVRIGNMLVVGCGSGMEAAILAQELNANVVGIDIVANFLPAAARYADLRVGDATALEFEDASFDFVYSYHMLEHVVTPGLAVSEMSRVLRPRGGFWIGTPNSDRIIGYLGSRNTNLVDKIRYNLADWQARLCGRFQNALGAHAGFSTGELSAMLGGEFSTVWDVSDLYFLALYPRCARIFAALKMLRVDRRIYPSVYFMGTR